MNKGLDSAHFFGKIGKASNLLQCMKMCHIHIPATYSYVGIVMASISRSHVNKNSGKLIFRSRSRRTCRFLQVKYENSISLQVTEYNNASCCYWENLIYLFICLFEGLFKDVSCEMDVSYPIIYNMKLLTERFLSGVASFSWLAMPSLVYGYISNSIGNAQNVLS